ncbi:MAG: L-histidine N(alpha)-methyltransferase, partial [Pseudomonadota bacterium]
MTDIFLQEVLEGLARPQKSLSPKWLYDDEGSHLFEDITKVEEYYPTRTEAEIFRTALPETAQIVGTGSIVVEYGSGSGKKTVALLNHLAPKTYHPIDIAEDFLKSAAQDLQTQFPDIHIDPIVADFTDAAALPSFEEAEAPHLGFFPGSTLGNLMPDEATSFLTGTRHSLGEKSYFLLGVDLVKDIPILEAAYDDTKGVTAAFNLNLLTRINRELGADFNRQNFKH